jgi:hypothetical protein
MAKEFILRHGNLPQGYIDEVDKSIIAPAGAGGNREAGNGNGRSRFGPPVYILAGQFFENY